MTNLKEYKEHIINGDLRYLAKAITLIESKKLKDSELAAQLIEALPRKEHTIRLGITGPPGVGKSSFIEALGQILVQNFKKKLAVLAIDPSSQESKGSILGDKSRMNKLAAMDNVYIRPAPAGEALGGVSAATKESILVCEAAGFDFIILETVGVGQSETEVFHLCDFMLLLLAPGGGDELQGIKKGIVERADGIAVNKADGNLESAAKNTLKDYQNAIHLGIQLKKCFLLSIYKDELLNQFIASFFDIIEEKKKNGHFYARRNLQNIHWFENKIYHQLILEILQEENINNLVNKLSREISQNVINVTNAYLQLKNEILQKFS